MKLRTILILVVVLILAIAAAAGYWLWQKQTSQPIPSTKPTSGTSYSQECGVCGPTGIHNVEGSTCAEGLVCKSGTTTSASYCVKPSESSSVCEKY